MSAVAADRSHPAWLQMRAACQDVAANFDVDDHVDNVWLELNRSRAFGKTTAAASDSLDGTLLAAAKRSVDVVPTR